MAAAGQVGVSGSLAGLAALRTAARAARCAREAAARLDRAFEEAFGGTPSEVTVVRRVVRARPDRALRRATARDFAAG
ncbi:hypothetical protein [Streptomyces mirabilis]|uniref:hypothetical protein n=1 Tax=Streptomyces mirabilis TaxID=68239 RepID=UPI003695CF39